jgi:hypothetical protein
VSIIDPTAPRKKFSLLKWSRHYNKLNGVKVAEPAGFNPKTRVIGGPAREFVKRMQRATGLPITGRFDRETMLRLLPPGIRSRVMARAHGELGEHEWPAGSNAGPVLEYLKPLGLGAAPWCAAFVTYVLRHEGIKSGPPNPAYVPSWGEWAKEKGLTKPLDKSLPGDLWCWNWDGGSLDHIGFCDEGVKGATAYYLDGNVGNYGGQVTDAGRPASGVALVIDLVKLSRLK